MVNNAHLLASGNRHKQEEFAAILEEHRISLPADAAIHFDPEETGSTFLENALLKARVLYEQVQCPVIADDSGLCIDALGGKPGIYSARYGMKDGVLLDAAERNQLVLHQMEGIEHRSCRFVCCIAVMLDAHRFFTVQETCEGVITTSERGDHGFGYDPIVYLTGDRQNGCGINGARKKRALPPRKSRTACCSIFADAFVTDVTAR